jgi:hypothetical protein
MTSAMSRAVVAALRSVVVVAVLGGAAMLATAADANAAAKTPAGKPAAKKVAKKPAGAVDTVRETVEGEDVRDFRSFCDSWMAKLQERNVHNTAHVAWTTGGPGIVGEYVTYGTARTCVAREEPGKDPIGKITYREIKYRKEGATETAAMASAGTIVEQTDVTEIFRYAKGRWQY